MNLSLRASTMPVKFSLETADMRKNTFTKRVNVLTFDKVPSRSIIITFLLCISDLLLLGIFRPRESYQRTIVPKRHIRLDDGFREGLRHHSGVNLCIRSSYADSFDHAEQSVATVYGIVYNKNTFSCSRPQPLAQSVGKHRRFHRIGIDLTIAPRKPPGLQNTESVEQRRRKVWKNAGNNSLLG